MSFVWTSDLNIGIDVVDSQHQRIADYINLLGVALGKRDRSAVGQVLEDLVDYTMSHFAFEESLQVEAGYAFATPHKATHEMFIKRIGKYQDRHKAGDDITEQLHGMLMTWLLHHIKRDDVAYAADVKSSITAIVSDKKEGSWLSRSLKVFFK
jgi:hemerythrin